MYICYTRFSLFVHREKYLFKNRTNEVPPNSYYHSLYPKIIQDIEVRFYPFIHQITLASSCRSFALFLLRSLQTIEANWRCGRHNLQRIQCRSENSKGVYCLQYDDEKIISGLRDNSIKVTVCLCLFLSVCVSVFLSVSLPFCLSCCLSVFLSCCLSVFLSVCLSVFLLVCWSVGLSVGLPLGRSSSSSFWWSVSLSSVCMSSSWSLNMSVCLLYLTFCLSVSLSACLSVCLFFSLPV